MHRTESLYYGIVTELVLNEPLLRFLSLPVPGGRFGSQGVALSPQ